MLSRQWLSACKQGGGSGLLFQPWRRFSIFRKTAGYYQAPSCIRALSSLPNSKIFQALQSHNPSNLAVVHSKSGRAFTYSNLLSDVARSKELLEYESGSLSGHRIAFLAENSYDYVVMLLSILATDAIALPLSPAFPLAELKYILDNSETKVLLATEQYASKTRELVTAGLEFNPKVHISYKIMQGSALSQPIALQDTKRSNGGLMLYTSGTTNRPKGVLLPLSALEAQAQSLIEAWKYSSQDYLLHVLPLHHIHGTVNAVITPILAGSAIEFMYPFNPTTVWHRLARPFLEKSSTESKKKITFLTAVPTLWTRLMETISDLKPEVQTAAKQAISYENLRLNISGSAALPAPTKKAWTELSHGNVLLERYGMTEVGMAISCGLDPVDRVDGSVGWPLPSVEVRLWDVDKNEVIQSGEETDADGRERVGEIQLRGPTIFREYFRNHQATIESFVDNNDGKGRWFRTGDVAVRREVAGSGTGVSGEWAKGPMYFIQGRLSVDIIKTGGEKVSALEVERELLSLPEIAEAAVVGLPSEKWGQKVAAVVVLNKATAQDAGRAGKPWGMMDMRRALKGHLAMHKLPQELRILPKAIPRNAMGKVNKKQLVKEFFCR
ncbi:putative AMP-binding enzyme [Talaromyces proteolyticus]|uniref:AMP-binding enzyme n=1 Tax=Talaromyces proteolyticus TaxID=1131652 RepID=A0AAD4KQ88_9EURO|nr:putative AMP-binding enzyme [Talaromyces proteolyticus]KAH8695942.1 putative AMP-binding enzyme [Talaromyces proteolyticus]